MNNVSMMNSLDNNLYKNNLNFSTQKTQFPEKDLDYSSTKDVIEISETNENLINHKKAKDGLDYALKDYSDKEKQDIMIYLVIMKDYLKDKGEITPNSIFSESFSNNPWSYLDFANKLIDNLEVIWEENPNAFSKVSDFMGFCNKYKKSLEMYGCV